MSLCQVFQNIEKDETASESDFKEVKEFHIDLAKF